MALGRSTHDPHEAIGYYKKAIELSPFHAPAHWELSQRYFMIGEYHLWAQLNEWRFEVFPELKKVHQQFIIPKWWRGERNIRLNLASEQGIGDLFWYSRYIAQNGEVWKHPGHDLSFGVDWYFRIGERAPLKIAVSHQGNASSYYYTSRKRQKMTDDTFVLTALRGEGLSLVAESDIDAMIRLYSSSSEDVK